MCGHVCACVSVHVRVCLGVRVGARTCMFGCACVCVHVVVSISGTNTNPETSCGQPGETEGGSTGLDWGR